MYGPCQGSYPSISVCMTACATFPTSFPAGNNGTDISVNAHWANNVQCRHYHATYLSVITPNVHCAHAWPSGGGACQDATAADLCTGYCQLYNGVCTTTALRETGMNSTASCVGLCNTAIASRSTFTLIGGSNYLGNGTNSPSGDNIDCRTYHLIAAITDPNTHCPHAWVSATTGPCAIVVPSTTSGATTTGATTTGATTTGASATLTPVFVLTLVAIVAKFL